MGWGFVVEGCVSDIQIYTKDQNYLFFIFILLKYLLHVDIILSCIYTFVKISAFVKFFGILFYELRK